MYCRYVRCMLEYNSRVNVCCDDNTVQKSKLEAGAVWPHFFLEVKTISRNLDNRSPMFASISCQNSRSLRGDQNSVSFCSGKWRLHARVYVCREKAVTQQRPVRKRFWVAQQKRQNGTSDVCLSIIPGCVVPKFCLFVFLKWYPHVCMCAHVQKVIRFLGHWRWRHSLWWLGPCGFTSSEVQAGMPDLYWSKNN